MRMVALKHQYDLSDRRLCALVNDRISWRRFCRIPWDRPVPHPSSLSKIRQRLDAGGSDHMVELNAHLVRKQVNAGQLILPNRLVSIFDPEARPIKRGKAHRETEFGYKGKVQSGW